MSWFRKKRPEVTTPIFVTRGDMMLALAEECKALKVDAMAMTMLVVGVVSRLEGHDAGKAVLDRIVDLMDGKGADATAAPGENNLHDLDRIIGTMMDELVALNLDLTTIFVLPKGVIYRLGGEKAAGKYAEKVVALMETVQALQKLDKASR